MSNIDKIIRTACFVGNIEVIDLMKRCRERHLVDLRRMVYSICRDLLNLPYVHIAKHFGVNHATVIHHYKIHIDVLKYDRLYLDRYNAILELVKADLGMVDAQELIEEIRKLKAEKLKNKLNF
jgi:chromosomal replication initiation ATPase DnaA|tara:strand:+ start:5720 stop:6088 length:369 start_codon:yes stop_codon:yes gene_type:complete